MADWFAVSALLSKDGAETTLRALRLLETKLKRTPQVDEDTEIEVKVRLRFVTDARRSIQARGSLVSPEIVTGIGTTVILGLRILATLVVVLAPNVPSEKATQLALTLVILSVGYSVSGLLYSQRLTRSAMEAVTFRSVPEEMFNNPETQDLLAQYF